jgi:Zn-dependent M28 family amino/carboxypeptidase
LGNRVIALLVALALQAPAAPHFDSNRAWEDLRQMVAIGPRPAGSPAIEATRTYIKKQLAAAGVAETDQAWDDRTPLGPVHMVNLIATIPGTSAGRDRLIIAGHYDTKLVREFRFVGADDGGSSAAFLLELARVLKAARNPMTIELLFLDGEEAVVEWEGNDHTYGSRHYVEAARRAGTLASARAMILVDMIGDRDLAIKRDTNSMPWLTDIIWSTAASLKLGNFFPQTSTGIEDDHLPFVEAGVPSVDIIDLDYAPWHTAADNLDAVGARSLQVVGDVLLAALPKIEDRLKP